MKSMSSALAERLAAIRKRRGLSQTQLADRAGLSQGTIGNIESGRRGYGRSVAVISKVLAVSPEYLLLQTDSDSSHALSEKPAISTPDTPPLSHSAWEIGALFDDLFGLNDRVGRTAAFNAATEALLRAYRRRNVLPMPKPAAAPSPKRQRA